MTSARNDEALRVAYITQWFPPEPSGPALWIAEAIRACGSDVRVITGIPNYPSGIPSPGYRASEIRRERIAGFATLRCPLYPSHDAHTGRRVLNYLSFAASASWFGMPTMRQADVALVYSSPATAAMPAFLAHRRLGIPYVLVIQDLWPETVLQTDVLSDGLARVFAEKYLGKIVSHFDRSAAQILVISPGMREILVSRGIPADKVAVMFNWVDEDLIRPQPPLGFLRRELGIAESDPLLLYGGNLGKAQGLSAWIEAWAKPEIGMNTHLVLMGEGTESRDLTDHARKVSDRVHVLSGRSSSEYATAVGDADALVISLQDRPLFQATIPGKVQASLAFGKPIIASVAGDSARILQASEAALVVEPENVRAISRRVHEFEQITKETRKNMGGAGRDYYLREMSRDRGAAALMSSLRRAAATTPRR